ncbi:phosphatidate cytidylyltransferase [Altererythrobacter sp. B11]|uniref:phosphatidate cytidylyltransferase n=1 Tax=Altererythrobacter sp. B11 TaxID=2060312 RepID=UPI001E3A3001|nr:phosphatidate cytidylyltransferase [Altererythrobacter sp. B11]
MAEGESVPVPLAVRTSDLPVRAASAAVMLLVAGVALWLGGMVLDIFVALVAVVGFGEAALLIFRATPNLAVRLAGVLVAFFYIGLAASALAEMRPAMVLAVLGVVIATDTGAYFTGRRFGGPKIAPRISPSKTWSGLAGGMLGAGLVLACIGFAVGPQAGWEESARVSFATAAFFAGALLAIAAQAGDFLESWLKRKAGVKDSSRLIPGHGGVLDRVDGLLPVALIVGLSGAATAW